MLLETIKYLTGAAGRSGFGSKSTAEQVTCDISLCNLTAIITGASSGIGAETARVLAKQGARLVLPVRSLKAGEETKARILVECPEAEVVIMKLDLSSISSVRSFVADFESLDSPLSILINNAGRFYFDHGISEDGIEMSFATNYLGHFLLAKLLLERMRETAARTGVQGRIVNVTSNTYTWFSGNLFGYLELITKDGRQYDPTRAYALSKLAIVLFTQELANVFQEMEANVTVNCVHPGVVKTRLTRDREGIATDLAFFLASKLVKTIPQAAATTCYVATHPSLLNVTGKYFEDCNEAAMSKMGSDMIKPKELWSRSLVMVESINS
ncbi:hypothetical protein Droror1_Dr00026969 [Drosera rotundifolia]